jgi:hypothetical protein
MFKMVESEETVGYSDPHEGGFWVSGVLDSESLSGAPTDSTSDRWRSWSGREVKALIVHTESSPCEIRWQRWFLAIELAEELFGKEHV